MDPITTKQGLAALAGRLEGIDLLGADTEAAGYHRYHDRVCLLQLSSRRDTELVDTLAVPELDALAPLFESADVEIVFHDADYDLRLLHRDFGIRVRNLFDTKVAAQFLGEPGIGLASLLESQLGVALEKKYQRADWAQRPLPKGMLAYAAEDTKHLPALRDRLKRRLEEAGRLAWAEEEFRLLEEVRWEERNGQEFLRLKHTRDLGPRQLGALRELYAWRERVAESRDVAPFRVLGNDTLVEVARAMPSSAEALRQIRGVSPNVLERAGRELLGAVERARALPERELPVRPAPPRRAPYDPLLDELTDRLKAVRDEAADALGLDRGFLMPRDQLRAVARARPASQEELRALPGMRRWQADALGERLLATLEAAGVHE